MKDLFIELLQLSLGMRTAFSRIPSSEEWVQALKEAQRQAIVGILLGGLDRLPIEQRPPADVSLKWIGLSQIIEANYRLHCERSRLLTSRFREVGIPSCVLKGVGIAMLYPSPERRQSGDIDLWIGGCRKDAMRYLRLNYTVGAVKWHHVNVDIFTDVSTEIHFHPIWLYNPFRNSRLQKYFNDQEAVQMAEREKGFNYPTVEFNAIYSLVHMFHHLMDEGVGMRHIVDYYYIVSKISRKEEIVILLQRFGLMRFASAVMYVLKEACGMSSEKLLCEPDEEAGRFLLEEIMLAGNFGHFDSRLVRPKNESFFHRSIRKFRRRLRFVKYYPGEVFGAPLWKMWHKCWRLINS